MFDIREYRPHNKFDKHLNCDIGFTDVITVIREKCLPTWTMHVSVFRDQYI